MVTEQEIAEIRKHVERAARRVGGRRLHECETWLERLLHERDRLLEVVDGAKEFAEWHAYEPRLISEALRNALAKLEREDAG